MVVVFASTGGLTGGWAALGQKMIATVFGEDAVLRLSVEARRDLQDRAGSLFSTERARLIGAST